MSPCERGVAMRKGSLIVACRCLAAALILGCGAQLSFGQRPDAELKGITVVGIEVEDVSAQAAACGLSRDAIQSAVAKALTEGGLKVARNTDTDVYLYVNVNTASPSPGLCV